MFLMSYPNRVFDYIGAARPTILAIDGISRDVIVKSGGGIFVPQGDDAAFAAAILRLCNDGSIARKMGMDARAYVAEHLNRNNQAAQFVNLVQNVAHAGRP
jgi:glycosyltransferase involved in cell wall biosynthesis